MKKRNIITIQNNSFYANIVKCNLMQFNLFEMEIFYSNVKFFTPTFDQLNSL